MIGISVARGSRPGVIEWLGCAVAFAGLVYLVLPGLAAPPLGSALLMAAAGASWGVYSVLGRGEGDPVLATARNFVFTLPFVLLLFFVRPAHAAHSLEGVTLAVVSGAITSGLGYVVWYAAQKNLAQMTAAIVQLTVPVIAAIAGILFLSESFSLRLAIAAVAILGGILLTTWAGRAARLAKADEAQAVGPSRMST